MTLILPLFAALPPLAGSQLLRTNADPVTIAVLVCGVALYLWGVVRQNRLHPRHLWPAHSTTAFVGGVVVIAFAVVGFLGAYDRTLFWVHMVQHLLLIMVGAALLALSSPLDLLWRATSGSAHRAVTSLLRSRFALVAGHPVTAFILYGVLVPLTHLTVFYNWAVERSAVNQLEHLLFVVVGYLFWRQIFAVDPNRFRMQPPMRALLLFLAVPVDTFVGLTLNTETKEVFPALAAQHRTWGPSLVTDLHMGGVIMWVGGDVLMMLALIPVVVDWVGREERRATRFDRELANYLPQEPRTGQPTAGFALGRHVTRLAPPAGPLDPPSDAASSDLTSPFEPGQAGPVAGA